MGRRLKTIAGLTGFVLTGVVLSSCVPASSSNAPSTTRPDTTAVTTPGSTAPTTTTDSTSVTIGSTAAPTSTATIASAETSPTTNAVAEEGEAVDLPQFGLQFRTPAPFTVNNRPDADFHASSTDPEGYLTILACNQCERELLAETGDLRLDDIDGVEVQIVIDAQLDLPEGVTANALVVDDGDRAFSAVMSSTGDLKAPWNAFVNSIEFTSVDPSAEPDPNEPDDRRVTLDLFLASFTIPDEFEAVDDAPANLDGFAAVRTGSSPALFYFEFCGDCPQASVTDSGGTVTELKINGIPAVMVTDADGIDGIDGTANVLIVFNQDRAFVVLMTGDDIDTAWTELVESLSVRGVGI